MFETGVSVHTVCSRCWRTWLDKLTHGGQEEFCTKKFCPLAGTSRRKEIRREIDKPAHE